MHFRKQYFSNKERKDPADQKKKSSGFKSGDLGGQNRD